VYVLTYGGPTITAHTIVPVVSAMAVWYFAIGLLLIAGLIYEQSADELVPAFRQTAVARDQTDSSAADGQRLSRT
jgi:hypothetical protein